MNKNHYKIIFSRALNQLIVVSELTKSRGKTVGENLVGSAIKTTLNLTALSCVLKPLHFSLMLALGFVFLVPTDALANPEMAIRADKSAPGNQQATVLQTANGLPQVNIQTPSAGGVSRNQYSQFDVAEKGAILNNARKATQTQMAGWVQGNPNLAAGEAKVILNEVNSANPSRLKGYVEVAGMKADVVIANPSGIHCEGCGVINAGRTTMTTGQAQLENGNLKGFEVRGGKVTVSGKGLDNTQSDYTDIIAEKVLIDGGVWSKKGIQVTTGRNKVNRTNDSVVYVGNKNTAETDHTSDNQTDNQNNTPQTYAVDVSQLGGMYAERIHLVDNGSGLGVRNAGHIGAGAGNVQIDSQGRIVNSGVISSRAHTQLNTQSDLVQQGKVETAQGDVHIRAKNKIEQTGATITGGHIRYSAASVEASRASILAAGAGENNKPREVNNTSSRKNLEINTTQHTVAKGKNIASGKVDIKASEIDISESQTGGDDVHLVARQNGIKANRSTLTAENELVLHTPSILSTEQADLKANWINTTVQRIENKGGRWASQGLRDFTLNLEKGLNNEKGLVLAGGNMVLNQTGQFLNNAQGRLLSGKDLTINAQSLDNQAGLVVADGSVTLTISQAIQNRKVSDTGSLIQAQNRLTVEAETLDNSQTKAAAQAVPTQGLLAGKIEINAKTLDNQQGGIYSVSSQVLNIARQLQNRQGELFSTGDIHIQGTQAYLKNTEGMIQAAQQLSIQTNGLSGDGDIEANHTQIQLTQDFNNQRDLVGRSSLSLSTQGDLRNDAGLLSEGNTILNAKNIENTEAGEIQGKQTALSATQNIVNRGLIKGSIENVIKAGDILTNIGLGRVYGGHVALQAGNKIINTDELQPDGTIKSAVVAAKNRLDIAAPLVENSKTVFTQKWAFNGIGGTLASEGQIVFGRVLDENNQAKGLGDQLLNNGALIEGRGIELGMRETLNKNARIDTRLEETLRQNDLNEHYLLENNSSERINFDQLRWVSFSRAGKVVYKNQNAATRPADGKIEGYILPQPNEEVCANEQTRAGCVAKPQALYLSNDPVWSAFNLTPPSDSPELPDLSGLDEALKQPPQEPELPRRTWRNRHDYDRLMKEYEAKMEAYRQALAEYEAKLIAYSAQMKPYLDWAKENEKAFEQLDSAIQAHNQKLAGKEFYRFWDIYVNERIFSETKVKETHPGKILSQGDIAFKGKVENNRSQMIASGQIYHSDDSSQAVNNIEEMGITQVVDKGTQEWTYSRWRGGFKRYHQRKWDGKHDYENITITPLALNQVKTESYSTFTPKAEKANLVMEGISLADNANVGEGVSQSQARESVREIRTIEADVRLPTSSLYKTNPDVDSHVLIETDPAFTERKQWLSGDYMFKALRSEPQNVLKRLGDGYYEQRLVRDQINQLTGRMFLRGYQDLESQYKALMDNGITFAKKFNLTPGIALSASQVAQLTSDIVWFEEKTVTLPSGKTVKVLAPRVYAMAQAGDMNGEGALISAEVIDLRANRLANSGTIAGRQLTMLKTDSLYNEGVIHGDKVGIRTEKDFDNIGGKVEAEKGLLVDVGGDLTHQSTTSTTEVNGSTFQRSQTTLARKALFYVKGEEGKLHLAANNLNVQGADILNEGAGETLVQIKNNLNLTALSVGFDEKLGSGNHYRNEKVENAVVAHIKGKGDVTFTANNILSEGAVLESEAKLVALAENDLILNGAKERRDFEEFHKTKSGRLAKVTKTSVDQQQSETQRGSQVSGKEIILAAGNDVKGKGLQAIAENDLLIDAGRDIDIAADTNHFRNIHQETKKTSGVFTSGGGITFGSKSEKHHLESEGWTQSDARSTLGSMKGNVQLQAGKQVNVLGTDLITPRTNRIDIEGQSVKVEAGKDIINTTERHEYKQSGLTLAVSTPVTDMAQAAYNSIKRSEQVTNPKLKALYQMKAAEEVVMAAQNVGKVAETLDALRAGEMQGTGTTASPSIKISVSYGNQKQTQSSESQSISHQKSTLSTGTLNVKARDERLVFEGVDANAKLMALSGKQGIEIKGVKDEEHQRTKNQSVGGSVGVFVGMNGNSYGFGLEASVNAAKGKSNSDSERWQNSRLNADKIITNSEEGGLTLEAANLKAKRWEADLQSLTLTSRQDTEKYDSKQVSAGASGSIAYGSGGGASVNAAYSNAKVDYAQVKTQTGIQVGEEGMDATIHNHTQLTGAIIESEAEKEKNRFKTGSISHTNIENRSEIKTESASISAGSGGINPMQAISSTLSLLGNSHESERSTTQSVISENIHIDTETPENLTALSRETKNANQQVNKQDLKKVQERQEMAKVIGEISTNAVSIATYNEREKINKLGLEKFKLEEQRKALEGDSTKAVQIAVLDKQIREIKQDITKTQAKIDDTYGIGSPNGMAIRAVTAALQAAAQNDTAGSLVALASPYLNKQIHEMTKEDTTKDKAVNLAAHALLSAVEFQLTGKDPLTGAVAGVTGEATAQLLTKALYDKTPEQLTATEKENISTLSQLAGGLAGALTAKANNTAEQQGGTFLTATAGAETAKRAVENNYLSKEDWNNYSQDIRACDGNKECVSDVNQKYAELDKRQHDALESACKLGGNLSECQSRTQDAQEGAFYASKEIYNQNFSHRDEYWFRNRLEQGYSDGQKTPTDGLVGETVLGRLETLAQNPSFDSSIKSNGDLQKEVYSAINESMLMVRNEDPNAFQIGDMSYPNLKRLGMLGYFPEPGLEGVYPELLLLPTPAKGVGTLLLNGEKLVLQGASKVVPKLGIIAEKYPKTTETVIAGTIATGFDIYNGELSYEKTLANYALAGVKAGKSTSQQLSVEAIYTGLTLTNDPNKSIKDIKTEGIGKISGNAASLVSEYYFNGKVNSVKKQIIGNLIGGYTESSMTDELKRDN